MTTLNIRTIDKQTITLSGSSMTTVADVARLLEEQHQFEINCQQLMLCGRVLSEEEKIEHLQLTKKSFLLLLMKDKVEEEEATDTHAMEIQRQQREHQQHQSDLRMAQRINQKRTTKRMKKTKKETEDIVKKKKKKNFYFFFKPMLPEIS